VQVDTPASYQPEALLPQLNYPQPPAELGSNNWAVSGKKTKKGFPILCNDPHLGLRLPSLWYEIQLVTPTQNVYGVSLPGSPGVIIGFNQDVAWGVTNASRDVLDWYKIEFQDASRKAYKHAGVWKPTTQRIEEIKIRGKAPLLDTVIYTHHGPVVYDRAFGDPDTTAPLDIALRWAGADSSLEIKTLYLLNRAKSHADYQAALKYFYCPGQNFIFISKSGDVAITQNGHFPAKWPGQGEYVMDGRDPLHDWQAYIPMDQNPHVLNPAQGFIMSTNQAAADPAYPYNLAGSYDMTRNRRVQAALSGMKDITVEDMKKLQSDNYHTRAAECLPRMLALLDTAQLGTSARQAVDSLRVWNYMSEPHKYAPSYYEYWEKALLDLLWADEAKAAGKPLATPTMYLSLQAALAQPAPFFVDDVTTPDKETIADLTNKALAKAIVDLKTWEDQEGFPQSWQYVNNVRVMHLLRRPSLSHEHIATGGNGGIINANRQNSGASWRMIVELGPEPNAWGVYPGGQSGNAGNPHFDDGIPVWARGEYFKLHYLKSATDNKLIVYSQILTPAQP
jgi:penicillin G amidase